MVTTILTFDPVVRDHLITTLSLSVDPVNSTPLWGISRSGGTILIHRIYSGTSIADMVGYAREMCIPDTVIACMTAHGLGSEVREGDIILPNVFFAFDPSVLDRTITQDDRDTGMGIPRFLTTYERQEDFDFGTFGLSVGGIALSGAVTVDTDETYHVLRLVYEADTIDIESYTLVSVLQETKYEGTIHIIHAVIDEGMKTSHSADSIPRALANGGIIVRYILDSREYSERDEEIVEEDGDEQSEEIEED